MTLAGTDVDASFIRKLTEQGRNKHGDKFDPSDLIAAQQFAPYLHTDLRLKVSNVRWGWERTGRVGITTGWKPAFLLMHRSSDRGSGDLLGPNDIIIATWNGRRYEDVASHSSTTTRYVPDTKEKS